MENAENMEMMQENKPVKLTYEAATGKITGLHTEDETMAPGEPYILLPDSITVDNLNCVEDGMEWAVVSGVLQKRQIVYTHEEKLERLRYQREKECFPYINRGSLWYSMLSEQQKIELNTWYHAWLDVTATLVVPSKPSWLK